MNTQIVKIWGLETDTGQKGRSTAGKGWFLFLTLLICVLLSAPAVFAAVGEGEGSAVITFEHLPASEQEGGIAVMGLYRVAEMTGEDTFTALSPYNNVEDFVNLLREGKEIAEGKDADDIDAIVAALYKLVEKGTEYTTAVVSDCQAIFRGLESGVYLGAMTSCSNELSVQPMLFFLPEYGGVQGKAKWDLVTEAAIEKIWDDDNNRDNARPTSVYMLLCQKIGNGEETPYNPKGKKNPDGTIHNSGNDFVIKELNAGNEWKYSTKGEYLLPKYGDTLNKNEVITYLWHEVTVTKDDAADSSAITDYTILKTGDTLPSLSGAGYIVTEGGSSFDPEKKNENTWKQSITNTRPPELTKLSVKKIWDDNNDQDGKRPVTLTVTLNATTSEGTAPVSPYEEVVLEEANEWSFTTDDLPVFLTGKIGERITYTWTEPEIPEYQKIKEETSEDGLTTTFTNQHKPGKVSISVEKVWSDDDNRDGIRPASVTVVLEKKNGPDGEWADCKDPAVSKELNAENQWKFTQTDLDEYTDKKKNEYRWREEPIPVVEGHTGYDTPQIAISGTTVIVNNPHDVEKVKETVKKVWAGENGVTTYRPTEITVRLTGGTYSKNFKLNAANNWTETVEDLCKYENGKEVNYVWTEIASNTDRYRTTTPQRDPATRETTITNTYIERTRINVSKSWSDANNEDGSRPKSIQVRLLADGKAYGRDVTLSASSTPAWSHTWEDLATTDLEGNKITYTVQEVNTPPGYTSRITGNAAAGFVIINNHTPARGSLRITKRVTLNGAATTGTAVDGTYEFAVTGPNGYSHTVRITVRNGAASSTTLEDLAVGTYTIHENVPTGTTLTGGNDRTVNVTANNTSNVPEVVFVNNRTTPPPPPQTETNPPPQTEPTGETVTISGEKFWDDEGNRHNTRPSSITVELYANGTLVDSSPTWTSTSGNTWTYSFGRRAARDSSGNRITYTVREQAVRYYSTSISGTRITNTLLPTQSGRFVNISGTKSWADNGNELGKRPGSITVRLYRDGVEVDSLVVTAGTDWSYSFTHKPADDGYGHDFTYTVREDGVPGYYARMYGNDITNSLIPEEPPYVPPYDELTEENLEQLLDLFDYSTPLYGGLLGTGDEMPKYPFIFGGIGTLAVLLLIIFGLRRRKGDAKG